MAAVCERYRTSWIRSRIPKKETSVLLRGFRLAYLLISEPVAAVQRITDLFMDLGKYTQALHLWAPTKG